MKNDDAPVAWRISNATSNKKWFVETDAKANIYRGNPAWTVEPLYPLASLRSPPAPTSELVERLKHGSNVLMGVAMKMKEDDPDSELKASFANTMDEAANVITAQKALIEMRNDQRESDGSTIIDHGIKIAELLLALSSQAQEIERLTADNERLSAALKSQTAQTWDETGRADKADNRRVELEQDAAHPALAIDVQEHRQQAYQLGWNDGYAEGHGKATARALSAEQERDALRVALQTIANGREVKTHTGTTVIEDCEDAMEIAEEALAVLTTEGR